MPKKILITGENSYIGSSLSRWLQRWPEDYGVDTVDMRGDGWEKKSFAGYDGIIHVAGIAHIKETPENTDLYYQVNRDLVYAVAQKSREDGVEQFIFLSSMSVYGLEQGVISRDSSENPRSHYGRSKLQGERLLLSLEDAAFKVAILRPPMIYGKGCKGNYPRLARMARRTPVFPEVRNQRSMIYIDNLCEFIRLLIDDGAGGVFFPQNKEYVYTADLVQLIAEFQGGGMRITRLLNPLVMLLMPFSTTLKKVFGSLVYDKSLSEPAGEYNVVGFRDSIRSTEKYNESGLKL
ncbi:MAG: NAD-dependent epimerase/dehydratase family protein [Syntrophomonadaceae bacterium]|nr:NAD-dependent epimerase/dehydratase family protein [Syntrophomonadaceae bacterium]